MLWTRRIRACCRAVLVIGILGAQAGCPDVTGLADRITKSVDQSVDAINTTMSNAVSQLDQQSSAWQQTLKGLETDLTQQASALESQVAQHAQDLAEEARRGAKDVERQAANDALQLEQQLASDVHNVIDQVSGVVKDGLQFGQESFNCQLDIFATHARISVHNFLVGILNRVKYKGISNRPSDPFVPIICSANPSGINVGAWDPGTFLVLSGTDLNLLDTQKPQIVVLHSDGSQFVAPEVVGNRTTNYRYQINVPTMIAQGQLRNAAKLEVRWNGQHVNKNEIPISACGGANQPCCHGACDDPRNACSNNVCQGCGGGGQPCCPGNSCSAGGVCEHGFCTGCGQLNQPCCNGETCSSVSAVCRQSICSACGQLGQPCCNGNVCSRGECRAGVCSQCGQIGQPCCGGSCSSGMCSGGNCVACGATGQPCCANNACSGGNMCSSGRCQACAPQRPCGSCNGVTRCDGSCSVPTPTDFGRIRTYVSTTESFSCCFIDYQKSFGGTCSPGWVFHAPVDIAKQGGGTCEILTNPGGNNCQVRMRFHNNGTDGATCTITIRERRDCDPH
jgi:hypothetical protein